MAKIYACWVTGPTRCLHVWWTSACMNVIQELEIKAAPLTTASYPVRNQWYSTPAWSFLRSTEGYKPSCDDVRFDAGSYMLQGDKTASLGYKLGLDSLPSYFNNKNLEIDGELAEVNGQILIWHQWDLNQALTVQFLWWKGPSVVFFQGTSVRAVHLWLHVTLFSPFSCARFSLSWIVNSSLCSLHAWLHVQRYCWLPKSRFWTKPLGVYRELSCRWEVPFLWNLDSNCYT